MKSIIIALTLLLSPSMLLADWVYIKGKVSLNGINKRGHIARILMPTNFECTRLLSNDDMPAGTAPSDSAICQYILDDFKYLNNPMMPIIVKSTDVAFQIRVVKQFSPTNGSEYIASAQILSSRSRYFSKSLLDPSIPTTSMRAVKLKDENILAAGQSLSVNGFGFSINAQEPGQFDYEGINKIPLVSANPEIVIEKIHIYK